MKLNLSQKNELAWIAGHPLGFPVAGGFVDNRVAKALERRGLVGRISVHGEQRWIITPAGEVANAEWQEERNAKVVELP